MSALSNNLSELDQLLQDLNSAQFLHDGPGKTAGKTERFFFFFFLSVA
jgi:hypothetical protein